jgi:PAT family beta-lactamase induction signal transducer AmpG
MIWAGAGVFWIAAKAETGGLPAGTYQDNAWAVAYAAMAVSMAVGMVTVLFSKEPAHVDLPPAHGLRQWLQVAVIAPFGEFISRYRWHAVLLLALIATYRISDIVMGIMANPFYVDMGYSKEEVATVTKLYGVVMTLVGAFIGGTMVLRWGVMKVLMIGAVLSAATNLLFAWLALHGHDVYALIAVVSADNLVSGIASAAFIAYLSSLTNVQYSATQYALFSSLMLLLPKFLAGFSGVAVDAAGYAWFFTGTAMLGVPVLLLVWLASRFHSSGD